MRIEKELTRSNQRADAEKKKEKRRREDDLDDDVMEYEPHVWRYINDDGGSAFSSSMDKGINTEESVFDKYAVFKTRKPEEID